MLLLNLPGTPSRAQTPGQLLNETIVLSDSTAGAGTIYRISFQVDNVLPKDGKIVLQFPVGVDFDISGVAVAGGSLDGGFDVQVDPVNRTVAIERDNTGSILAEDSMCTLNIAIVGNPTKATTSVPYLISIKTQTGSGNVIDQGEASVTIKSGPLDHFTFSPPIGNQAAGPIPTFTITGKDAFNNNVAFNDSVSLSDDTGTLTPKKVKMGGVSVSVNTAQITKAQNGVVIIAAGGGKSGASNSFDVTPGSLSKFALSAVPNVLVAGAQFTLTITAQDNFGNTVTSFTGPGKTVNFTPNGEIQPATSGNFSSGTRNEIIAYLKSGGNKTITVTDGNSHNGTSNIFTVNPGKPSGTITFAANPKTIPADRNTTTQVTSSGPIQDAQGNNVGSGKFFTVSVNDTSFGVITTANPIATDGNSRLSFIFQAGGKGGAAIVFVSSTDGTASGNANISVNQLKVLAVATAPTTISQGQQNIQVDMMVQNFGPDSVSVDSAKITFGSLASNYIVKPPSSFSKIPGTGAIQTLTFEVDVLPNAQTGLVTIDGQIFGKLSNSIVVSDTTADTTDTWTVQRRAIVQVDGVEFDERLYFNPDLSAYTVNTKQVFPVKVKIKQTVLNAETVDTVWVNLANESTNNTSVLKSPLPLTDLTQYVPFEVMAGSLPGLATLTANIVKARSVNTGDYTVGIGGTAKAISARIQGHGVLEIGPITTSESKVSFGRTQPAWSISVPIENSGEGTLEIQSSQVTFTIGNELQNDYKYNALKATSTLTAGQTDTLKFVVTQTGYKGGTATLTAILNVLDKNSDTTSEKSETGTIIVDSSALVKILRTDFPDAANRAPESQVALVDTGQFFYIEVTVENTGLEEVDAAYVSLTKQGDPQILTPLEPAVAIVRKGGTAKAIFGVRAGSGAGSETFVARLDSAKTQQGQVSADIGPAVDSTAVVRIQLPADLQLNLSTNVPNNLLTTGQTFTLGAVVKNLGQAQTDSSGRLEILSNPNFQLLANQTPAIQSFVVGDTVKWQIQAPPQQRPRDTLRVQISPPRSKNSGARVQVEDSVATLVLGTFNSLLQITTTSVMEPLGAQDRVISTEQFFTIKSQISASNDLTNKTVTLTLPNGYGFGSGQDSTKAIPDSGTVYWEVQAPTDAEPNSVDLKVTAKARDGQAQPKLSQRTLAITTKRRAILNLTPGISEPAGARNGVLSAGQAFTLSVILANTGEANLGDTATVALDLGNTGISLQASPTRTVVFASESQVKTITWKAIAPNQPTSASELTFRIVRLPLDENTNKAAPPVKNPVTFNLATVARGSIAIGNLRIVSPPGATDNVLSTDQDFVVSDSIFWTNATQIDAKLSLPTDDFSTDIETQSLTNVPAKGSAKLSWRVRAPGEGVLNAELKLVVTAMDAHNDTSALAPATANVLVSVQQRADPRLRAFISNPSAATDGVVSVGQPFEVTAVIENKGQALLSGGTTVNIELPPLAGYRMVDGQDTVQTSDSGKFTWWVLARPTISAQTDFIEFNLVKAPRDTNTNQLAASTQSAFQLAVRTEAKTLLAEKVGRTGGPTFRGQTNLPLLRIKLTNPGGPGSSNLVLQKLLVTLRDRGNTVVPSNQALKAIRVVDDAKRDVLYGELTGIVTADPLAVNFANTVVIKPGAPDTIAILGDIADKAEAENFRVAFGSSFDFEVVDQDSGSVVIVQDQDGNSGPKFNLTSDLAVLFDSEPQKSFYNYPNPLKPGNNQARGEGTFFTYFLPEASAGELKIFTLLGELVWETSFSAADPAGAKDGHKLDLFWNGYNGAGKKVLNGVYIALLKTPKYGTFMTKVAVVK